MTLSNNPQQFQPVLMNITISWVVLFLASARISVGLSCFSTKLLVVYVLVNSNHLLKGIAEQTN
jgi:hypothetical protein